MADPRILKKAGEGRGGMVVALKQPGSREVCDDDRDISRCQRQFTSDGHFAEIQCFWLLPGNRRPL